MLFMWDRTIGVDTITVVGACFHIHFHCIVPVSACATFSANVYRYVDIDLKFGRIRNVCFCATTALFGCSFEEFY